MKIIVITKTKEKGGYQARVFGRSDPIQEFAKTEIGALKNLLEKLEKRNDKFIR